MPKIAVVNFIGKHLRFSILKMNPKLVLICFVAIWRNIFIKFNKDSFGSAVLFNKLIPCNVMR